MLDKEKSIADMYPNFDLLEAKNSYISKDDYIYGKNTIRILEDEVKFYEKENYKQYKEIERLKEENKWLREHQKIEIVKLEE